MKPKDGFPVISALFPLISPHLKEIYSLFPSKPAYL